LIGRNLPTFSDGLRHQETQGAQLLPLGTPLVLPALSLDPFLAQVVAVGAAVEGRPAARRVQVVDAGAHLVEEHPVAAGDDHRPGQLPQPRLQDGDPVDDGNAPQRPSDTQWAAPP
jgi:hypothetical protein